MLSQIFDIAWRNRPHLSFSLTFFKMEFNPSPFTIRHTTISKPFPNAMQFTPTPIFRLESPFYLIFYILHVFSHSYMILFSLRYSFICLPNQALSVEVLVEFQNLKALNSMNCGAEIHNPGLSTQNREVAFSGQNSLVNIGPNVLLLDNLV